MKLFCPVIKKTCVGNKCRDWSNTENTCSVVIERVMKKDLNTSLVQMASLFNALSESFRISQIQQKAVMISLVENPLIGEQERALLQEMIQAPSSDVADQLLKEFENKQE
jgi:transcriptional regulator CtsR